MCPYTVRGIEIALDAIPHLEVVLVQPNTIFFDKTDILTRTQVISSAVKWFLGMEQPAISAGRVPKSSYGQPIPPALLCFPELYVPFATFRDLIDHPAWSPGQMMMTGLCADGFQCVAFDSTALDAIAAWAKVFPLENPELLDELRDDVGKHGQNVNLAATFACDRDKKRHVILHAKIVPSYPEAGLARNENTLGARSFYPILLKAENNTIRRILPLICSDFILPHSGSNRTLVDQWEQECPSDQIDLICVLNIQDTEPTYDMPWPRRVQEQLAKIADGQQLKEAFSHAHVLFANVGSFSQKREMSMTHAGHSGFAIMAENWKARDPESKSWFEAWDGEAVLYGEYINTAASSGIQWFKLSALDKKRIKSNYQKAAFFSIGNPSTTTHSLALCQLARFALGKARGRAAFNSSVALAIDTNGVREREGNP